MKQFLFFMITIGFALSALSAEDVEADKIVIDASKGGGSWWSASRGASGTARKHQGKPFADFLRSNGWEVEEIARGANITDRLKDATIVVRTGLFGAYRESEVSAYREFVANGGNLLLIQGHVSFEEQSTDAVASEFGIRFSLSVKAKKIARWADHSITKGLDLLAYDVGSIVTKTPENAVSLAYLEGDLPVMGLVKYGKGKIIYLSTIFPILFVAKPFAERVLEEFAGSVTPPPSTPSTTSADTVEPLENSLKIITLQPAPVVPPPPPGCEPHCPAAYIPPAPAIKGFLDGKYFRLLSDMKWVIGKTNISITVPKGFVTDFASVPTVLGSLGLTPHGRQSRAAVIHDYLYWKQDCTREQADNLMLIAMQESDVDTLRKFALYSGVDVFGNSSWNDNARARTNGHIRLIPKGYYEVPDKFEYNDYNKFLMNNSIGESERSDNHLEYCQFGNSKEVPVGSD